jgi:poly-gamma-glutamate capsule biosynthesis protein CapA/YwtB (metallophosphatase superfamily)
MRADPLTLFLCGDVMLGRGIDQILPHPGDPTLREAYVKDARRYVELAEEVNGPIPRPVDTSWPWGDAMPVLDELRPDARIVNLETSITRSDEFAPGKAVHYRMAPANIGCLAAARPDACALANNHLLDFGRRGLAETLDPLAGSGLPAAGAGRDTDQAQRPVVVPLAEGGNRVLVFSLGMPSSGIPPGWAAAADRPGVDLVPAPTAAAAGGITGRIAAVKRPGDVVVTSIHWGSNWGYAVSAEQVEFAHALVDGGVDVVHGHSSHHPRPVEVYRGKLILYGCGDFIDDYEGIAGHQEYRDDLRLMYFVTVDPTDGTLARATMVPMQSRQLRLRHAAAADTAWLCGVLDRISRDHATRIEPGPDGVLTVRSAPAVRR